jgi:hypothetical protein
VSIRANSWQKHDNMNRFRLILIVSGQDNVYDTKVQFWQK